MLTKAGLNNLLNDWLAKDWLRPLDIAFVEFLAGQDTHAEPLALLAAALTSHQLGRGHICLDLAYCLGKPNDALALPPEGDYQYSKADLPSQRLAGLNLSNWLAALQQSKLVNTENSPLALENNKLYLRRYWQYEHSIADAIRRRLGLSACLPDNFRDHLQSLFSQASGSVPNWQKIACALAARSAFAVITGGPGTGKTWTVVRLLALLQSTAPQKLRIRLAAPTGKAAARLTESIRNALPDLPEPYRADIPTQADTLHRLLGSRPNARLFRYNANNPLHADIIIIDEASMIDLEMMALLLAALKPHTRLILLGDKDQLASVEAGSVLGDICKTAVPGHYSQQTLSWLHACTGESIAPLTQHTANNPLMEQIAMLQTSRRFQGRSGIGRLAQAVNAGDMHAVQGVWQNPEYQDIVRIPLKNADDSQLDTLVIEGGQTFFADNIEPPSHGYQYYLQILQQTRPDPLAADAEFQNWAQLVLKAFDQFRLLCAVRQGDWGVVGLNQRISKQLFQAGLINNQQEWYEGRPVMVTQNDYGLGLMNGDIGIALQFPILKGTQETTGLRVAFAQPEGIKTVLPSRLTCYESAYAMTVHKAQGSEFNHVALVLPDRPSPVLTRELVYTGITRAKSYFSLLSTDISLLEKAVNNPVHRSGGLAELMQTQADIAQIKV